MDAQIGDSSVGDPLLVTMASRLSSLASLPALIGGRPAIGIDSEVGTKGDMFVAIRRTAVDPGESPLASRHVP
jgi:hypothetical protein